MYATTSTVINVATLLVGARINNGEQVHIERTSAEHWDLRSAGHRVTVHRTARQWCIAESCAGHDTPLGARPALFDAVALALAAL